LKDDSEGLFDFKHIERFDERASADFVARRKPCKDFDKYEQQFKDVQKDLKNGKRRLITFKEENLRAGDFYVHNGILLYLEKVDDKKEVQDYKSGSRERKDGRTRVLFENGTESNLLFRSLYKALLINGKAISKNVADDNENNTGLAKVAVQCSADTFVVNQSLVLRINICGENRHLRQARNRAFNNILE
jgi:hypothetical protein